MNFEELIAIGKLILVVVAAALFGSWLADNMATQATE